MKRISDYQYPDGPRSFASKEAKLKISKIFGLAFLCLSRIKTSMALPKSFKAKKDLREIGEKYDDS